MTVKERPTFYFLILLDILLFLSVALIASVLLYLVDASQGGFLNLSAKQREKLRKEGVVDDTQRYV